MPKTKSVKSTSQVTVTRSVVFNKALLKKGVEQAKAEGRSFSNWINQSVRKSLGLSEPTTDSNTAS